MQSGRGPPGQVQHLMCGHCTEARRAVVGFQRKTSGGDQLLSSRVQAQVSQRSRRWNFLLCHFCICRTFTMVDGLFFWTVRHFAPFNRIVFFLFYSHCIWQPSTFNSCYKKCMILIKNHEATSANKGNSCLSHMAPLDANGAHYLVGGLGQPSWGSMGKKRLWPQCSWKRWSSHRPSFVSSFQTRLTSH